MNRMFYVSKGLLLCISSFIFTANLTFAGGLQINQVRTNKQLECIPIEAKFSLSFIHSVSLTPVVDVYEVDKKQNITQIREDFITHGQGLPSMDNEPDVTKFEITKTGYRLHLKRKIAQLIVRTDKRFKNRLMVKNKVFNLNQWADTGLHIKPVVNCLK